MPTTPGGSLLTRRAPADQISRVPHLPGLDGLRALAVVAVMVYHANASWLHGGFLGVEVFFVISGYLITLLLIAEHERTSRISLIQFWMRRARRLLPALFAMLGLLIVYLALAYPRARGRSRGDILGGLSYLSNWYQIWVGAGYTARESFAPLRHLWSLAVEEQFYLLWPLIMVAILARGRRHLPRVALWLIGVSILITAVIAVLYVPGDISSVCTPESTKGYWTVAGRCISINDTLYLGTFTRAGGLMLGAALAMVWRPLAIMRGPVKDKGRQFDVIGLLGLVVLGIMMWATHLADPALTMLTGSRFDALLFRGGLMITGVATLMTIMAVTHRGAVAGRLLGNPVFSWIGTRSYGLYLYHWPIYQAIRKQAGIPLTPAKFALAMAITIPLTELSYRYIEMPVRQGRLGEWFRRDFHRSARAQKQRRKQIMAVAFLGTLVLVGGVSVALAPNRCVGAIECAAVEAEAFETTVVSTETSAAPPTTSATTDATGSTVVQSTVPGQTTVPATAAPTTLPPEVPYFAVGDSVMQGAVPNLERAGIRTDAAQNRFFDGAMEALTTFRAANTITRAVVFHIGTNGPMTKAQYEALLAEVDDLNLVVMMTLRAPQVNWIEGNNEIIRSLPATHPNVRVVDWANEALKILPELSPGDGGAHLNTNAAKEFYTNLVLGGLGLA